MDYFNSLGIYHMHHIEDILQLFHKVFQILNNAQTSEAGRIHSHEFMYPRGVTPFVSGSSLLPDLVSPLGLYPDSLTELNVCNFPLRLHIRGIMYLTLFNIPPS